jgi:hypothetical protein
MSKANDARVKEIRDLFDQGVEADKNQTTRELEALRMFALDQWPEAIQQLRQAQPGGANGMPATPARPMLVVDRLREPVNQVVNQERESDLSVSLVAADDFGGLAPPVDPSEIELREGLIRRIQRESESASARSWAFLRAAVCGRGFYAINTRYMPGKTFDQEIYYRRLYDQTAVVLDPAHEEPDGSDAEWGFCFTVLSYDKYKAEYPKAKDKPNEYLNADTEWTKLGTVAPGWFTSDGKQKYVRVAEHWYTEYTARTLCHMPDGSMAWQDELPKDAPKPRAIRSVAEKKVKWCKLDGVQILEETDWPSPFIPIVKVVGNEIPPCDGERRVDGMVNKSAIESQRGINYMASKLTEEIGLSAVTPLMVVEGTIEGYEEWYKQLNTRTFPYVPYKPTDLEGRPATAPFRPDKTPQIGPLATGLQMFMEAVQSSTGVPNPNMGKADRHSPTWRGTQALLAQGQRGSSNYMDNLARSVRYDGRITNSLLYPIMGIRPGRIARIVKGETETESVMIGQPFMMQENGQGQKMPVPAPGATPDQPGVREYKLTPNGDTMNVAVKVGKGFDTRRDEESSMFGELLSQNPEQMAVVGDLFFAAQDWPGAKQAAERYKVMLAPPIQALLQQKEGGQPAIPPQVQQQMQMMQQQLQQVTQAAQGMQQELQTKSYQVQSDEKVALAKIASAESIEMAKLETEKLIAAAKIDAQSRQELERQVAETDREQVKARNKLTEIAMQAELDAASQAMQPTGEETI